MHELSIAQSLVELVEDELAARPDAPSGRGDPSPRRRVTRVVVKVGALSGVVPEALASAFPVAASRSAAGGAALVVERCPAVIWCDRCGREQALPSPQRMRCPTCGELSAKLVGGRELELASMEVVDGGTDDCEDDERDFGPADTDPDGRRPTAHPPGADADPEEE